MSIIAWTGMKLLEIGFGFGSLAHFLATKYDVQITAVTLSKAQMEPRHAKISGNWMASTSIIDLSGSVRSFLGPLSPGLG